MPEYVKRCKSKYVRGNEEEYIKCVLSCIKEHEGKKRVLRKAMKALIELSGKGLSNAVLGKHIASRTGSNTPSHGLWGWLDWYGTKADPKTGACIVVRTGDSPRAYLVKDEFRLALTKVYLAIVQGLCSDGC